MAPEHLTPDARAVARLNGIDLYYEVHGSGQPLLLLHGGLSSGIEQWHAHIPALADRYQVIVPDARGHGRSTDTDQPFSYAQMAEDCAALLDLLGIEQANVVGWSDGGIVGLYLVTRHAGRVRALVAMEPCFSADGTAPDAAQFAATLSPETLDTEWAHRYYLDIAPEPDRFAQFLMKTGQLWLTQPPFTVDEFAGNVVPILLICGLASEAVRPEHLREWAAVVPGAFLKTVPDARHSYPLEAREAFLADVRGFLDPLQP